MEINESNFIKYLNKKDERALEYIINTYRGLVCSIVKKDLYNLKDYQEECINDVFLGVWYGIDKFDSNKGNFKNWIAAITKYKCIKYKRKYSIQNNIDNIEDVDLVLDNIKLEMEKKELKEDIDLILSNLKSEDRKIFTDYYIKDKTVKEISMDMNIKDENIYNRISRGKKKLRMIFASSTIATFAILIFFANGGYEAIANHIEKLFSKNPIENFTNYQSSNIGEYRTIIDKQVTNNGITITLNEIIFDYDEILITYTLCSESIDTDRLIISPKIFINGDEIKSASVSTSYSDKEKGLKVVAIEPREEIIISDFLDIKVIFESTDNSSKDKTIEDYYWEFNLKSNNLYLNNFDKININEVIKLSNGGKISIDEMIKTPLSTVIDINVQGVMKHDLNNQFSISCILEDSNGSIINLIGERFSYNYENDTGNVKLRFRNIEEDIEYIKVMPIVLFNNSYDKENTYNKELRKKAIQVKIKNNH